MVGGLDATYRLVINNFFLLLVFDRIFLLLVFDNDTTRAKGWDK